MNKRQKRRNDLAYRKQRRLIRRELLYRINERMMAAAGVYFPACDVCGTITIRAGTCYKCLNCGNSMGTA